MIKISVSNVVKYLRKSAKGRITFLAKLKNPAEKKEDDEDEGGHYWIQALSAVSRVFRTEQLKDLDLKIDDIYEKKASSDKDLTKDRYQRNVDLLHRAKEFDYKEIKPYFEVEYLKNSRLILNISEVPIEVSPNHVFLFNEGNDKKVGAIWFVIIKDGYKDFELALFNHCLYQYLFNLYKDKYMISEEFCIVLDITNGKKISYSKVLSGNYLAKIREELDLLKKAI